MSKTKNMELFKEHCNISSKYIDNQQKLLAALKSNNKKDLYRLLFGKTKTITGVDHSGKDRTYCECFKNEATRGKYAEKRQCKCLFYHNAPNVKTECDYPCIYKNFYKIVDSKYSICDYEDPPFHEGDGIGEVDLVLTDGKKYYATEVKPHHKDGVKDNNETLLRMIAEILTYTYDNPKYEKAIAFFNNTNQEREYNALEENSLLKQIIKEASIHVFLIKHIKGERSEFTINKLN